MHHTGKKKVKERFKKKKKEKNNVTKNLLQGDSNTDPQNQLELKDNASIPSLSWLTVFKDDFVIFIIIFLIAV